MNMTEKITDCKEYRHRRWPIAVVFAQRQRTASPNDRPTPNWHLESLDFPTLFSL